MPPRSDIPNKDDDSLPPEWGDFKPDEAAHYANDGSSSSALPPIRNGDWLRTTENKLPAELIEGLLHQGCKMVLAGGSKAKKTWTLIDITLSVCNGERWLGMETFKGPVLFVNFEVGEPFFVNRLRAVSKARSMEIPGSFHSWNLRGHAAGAMELLPRLESEIQKIHPVLVVLDPTYKLMGGMPENDAGAVTMVCNAIEQLAVKTGAAVAFAAHFSKGNQASKDAMDRISGSGVFARDPDAILIMTKHATENCFAIETILRNCPEMPPFVVEWKYPIMVRREDLDPAELKAIPVSGKRKQGFSTTEIIEILPVGQTVKPTKWQHLAKDQIGIGQTRFWELLKAIRANMPPCLGFSPEAGYTRLA